jgi:hypothetical protein
MKRLIDWLAGTPNWGRAGVDRTLSGLRRGDQRDLYLGLGLTALSLARRTAPRRRLLYRRRMREGSAIVIHHRRIGDPKIEVVRPKKR